MKLGTSTIKSLLLLINFSSIISCHIVNGQELGKFQLVDSQTKNSIPYAYIKVLGSNILEVSDADGFFSLPDLKEDSLKISHVAYQTLLTSYSKIKKHRTIEMQELSIALNPIVINAKSAKSFIDRAIDSSYKAIKPPLYLTCFREDKIFFRDTLVADVKSEIIIICKNVFFPSYGEEILGYLKNIIVDFNPKYKGKFLPPYNIPALYAPLNRFIIGVSKNREKNIYFSNQVANDSILIIAINPKQNFIPKNYILKNGRFVINKRTGRILRIDTGLTPQMMEYGRSKEFVTEKTTRYYFFYMYSHIYNNYGLLSQVKFNVHFSFLENNPENIWQNRSEILYFDENSKPSIEGLYKIKKDTSLFDMNSNYSEDFRRVFTEKCIGKGQ